MKKFWNACLNSRLIVSNVYEFSENCPQEIKTAWATLDSSTVNSQTDDHVDRLQKSIEMAAILGHFKSFRVQFADGTKWGEAGDSFILHRSAYLLATNDLLNLIGKSESECCHYYLGGSSGMGKTLWSQWIIVCLTKGALLTRNFPPAFVYQIKDAVFYFNSDGTCEVYDTILKAMYDNEPDFLVSDTTPFTLVMAKIAQIFVSSMGNPLAYKYLDWYVCLHSPKSRRILCPFTYEEYQLCEGEPDHDAGYSNHNLLAYKYNILGGNGRFLRTHFDQPIVNSVTEGIVEKLINDYFRVYTNYPFPLNRADVTKDCARRIAFEITKAHDNLRTFFEHHTVPESSNNPFAFEIVPSSAVLKYILGYLWNDQKGPFYSMIRKVFSDSGERYYSEYETHNRLFNRLSSGRDLVVQPIQYDVTITNAVQDAEGASSNQPAVAVEQAEAAFGKKR